LRRCGCGTDRRTHRQTEEKKRSRAYGVAAGAHLLPDVTIVPAMVVAIEQAQSAGITYNKQ
jgi:hypothetical protein